jgi:hypothetical protein
MGFEKDVGVFISRVRFAEEHSTGDSQSKYKRINSESRVYGPWSRTGGSGTKDKSKKEPKVGLRAVFFHFSLGMAIPLSGELILPEPCSNYRRRAPGGMPVK